MRFLSLGTSGAAVALLLPAADGFISPMVALRQELRPSTHCCSAAKTPAMSTYSDKLKEARAAKEAASKARGSPNLFPTKYAAPRAAGAVAPTQAAAAAPLPADSEPPFSPEVLEEIRTAITILAARLQREKPMSSMEFERFESAVAVIVEDAMPMQELPTQDMPAPSMQPAGAVASPPRDPDASSMTGTTTDEMESEGPAWDPDHVAYGVPAGVKNSYVIENMGEMNPEEYQEALRKKVIARAQTARTTGSYGNIVSKDYLKFLGKDDKAGGRTYKKNQEYVKKKRDEDSEA